MVKLEEKYINDLSITILGKEENEKYLLFIHGGPGLNAQSLIQYILKYDLYNELDANIIFYDQRACGKSKKGNCENSYKQQIEDLNDVIIYCLNEYNISAVIGHSYGAKLLNDFSEKYQVSIAQVLMATANDIDIPRQNNIKLDLDYLRETDTEKHDAISNKIANLSLWEISKLLEETFTQNPNRIERYWNNKEAKSNYLNISKDSGFPINNEVFINLRSELYNSKHKEIILNKPNTFHFIGHHDYIMNGKSFKKSNKRIIFNNSAHYPHIEEPEYFCEVVNEII